MLSSIFSFPSRFSAAASFATPLVRFFSDSTVDVDETKTGTSDTVYSITLDVKYEALELIDISEIAENCEEKWYNETLCPVNDCVVRIGCLEGEFHWHHHVLEDEFFYVVEGELLIDFEDEEKGTDEFQTVVLGPKQGFLVPRLVEHRTRAPDGVVVLMFEGSGVVPTGDAAVEAGADARKEGAKEYDI